MPVEMVESAAKEYNIFHCTICTWIKFMEAVFIYDRVSTTLSIVITLYGHIKTAEQQTIIQQYGDWYTGR